MCLLSSVLCLFFYFDGAHRNLHVLTPPSLTRRASDLHGRVPGRPLRIRREYRPPARRRAVMVTTVQVGGSSAWQALRRHFLASPLYGITLAGTAPRELRMVPRDPWPGESARGEELLRDESEIGRAHV